jgi:hypothetical protein
LSFESRCFSRLATEDVERSSSRALAIFSDQRRDCAAKAAQRGKAARLQGSEAMLMRAARRA